MLTTQVLLSLLLCWTADPAPAAVIGDEPQEPQDAEFQVREGPTYDFWKDPEFRRRFVESYLSETEIEPPVTVLEATSMGEIAELMGADQFDQAVLRLEEARATGSAVFDFTLANLYFQQEKMEEAVVVYKDALVKHPKFRRAWQNLGIAYVLQGDYALATEALVKVIESGGGSAVVYGSLGIAHSNMGHHLAAESAFRWANMLQPNNLDWKKGLVESFFKQGRYPETIAMCEALIAEQPESARWWKIQANAYIGMGQPLKAAENFELLDRMGHSSVASLDKLGIIYINEKLYHLAAGAYIRAMEKDPDKDPSRAITAANNLAVRGAYDETAMILERVEEVHGDSLEGDTHKELLRLRSRLVVHQGGGDEEKAAVLNEIVRIDPLDADAMIQLGRYYGRNEKPEKAFGLFERAALQEEWEAEAKLRHGELLVDLGRYHEALPLLRRSHMLRPLEYVKTYLDRVERFSKTSGS